MTAKSIVRDMADSPDKQVLIRILDDAIDQMMQVNTDMSNAVYKVTLLSDKVAALSQSIYAPVMSAQLTYPKEGDYTAVRIYVEKRKKNDPVFREYCVNNSRKKLCERLSDEFGWTLDERSYARNIQRH